jgi:hypothetical protein
MSALLHFVIANQEEFAARLPGETAVAPGNCHFGTGSEREP